MRITHIQDPTPHQGSSVAPGAQSLKPRGLWNAIQNPLSSASNLSCPSNLPTICLFALTSDILRPTHSAHLTSSSPGMFHRPLSLYPLHHRCGIPYFLLRYSSKSTGPCTSSSGRSPSTGSDLPAFLQDGALYYLSPYP